jgi:hypothetical protein
MHRISTWLPWSEQYGKLLEWPIPNLMATKNQQHDPISTRPRTNLRSPHREKNQSDLKTGAQHHFATNMICKLPEKEQSADQQSTENTRSDKPSNLIPHDKDHADDP